MLTEPPRATNQEPHFPCKGLEDRSLIVIPIDDTGMINHRLLFTKVGTRLGPESIFISIFFFLVRIYLCDVKLYYTNNKNNPGQYHLECNFLLNLNTNDH